MSDDSVQNKNDIDKLYTVAVEALKLLRDAIDDNTGLDGTVERAFSEVVREKRYQDFAKRNGQEREETANTDSKWPSSTVGSGEHTSLWMKNKETYKYVEQPNAFYHDSR